jgi:hypothetical protein
METGEICQLRVGRDGHLYICDGGREAANERFDKFACGVEKLTVSFFLCSANQWFFHFDANAGKVILCGVSGSQRLMNEAPVAEQEYLTHRRFRSCSYVREEHALNYVCGSKGPYINIKGWLRLLGIPPDASGQPKCGDGWNWRGRANTRQQALWPPREGYRAPRLGYI